MTTDRRVKWSKEALDFFESAADNSLVLDIIISRGCASQTGEGFEELVNSINSKSIQKKIKKVIITDTSFLYRYNNAYTNVVCRDQQGFKKYSDMLTEWSLNNEISIEKLAVNTQLKYWLNGLNGSNFRSWHERIKIDFTGDENGDGVLLEFREAVLNAANEAVYKGSGTLKQCIDFILEECAYTCSYFKDINMVYPMNLGLPLLFVIQQYKLNIRVLYYRTSNHEQSRRSHRNYNKDAVNQGIVTFMAENAMNVNFFVINMDGKFIYKNNAFNQITAHDDARRLPPLTWKITTEVMRTKKQIIAEEESPEGKLFLSVKAPLMVDGEIEGVIGLAVDITDRKKVEKLQYQNELQQTKLEYQDRIKVISEQVAHDIRSPLIVLSMLADNCESMNEKDHVALRNAVTNIESIACNLLEKYQESEKLVANGESAERYVLLNLSLQVIVSDKKYQYKKTRITFNYSHSPAYNFTFIKGDYSDFCRMISNLLNNSVEAIEGREGIVDVSFTVRDRKVEIYIKDNGKGMPQEVVDKILNDTPVESSKQNGYGIGMRQVKQTLADMNAKMSIKSKKNVGTEIILTFPECDPPKWFPMRIVLHKGDVVVVLDDDTSIHDIWKRRFENYADKIAVKYFTQGSETIDFINSLKEKNKVLLLADYELRSQKVNGVEVIEKSGAQNRSIIVSSVYISKIKDFDEKSKFIKMFPKTYIKEISILMEDEKMEIVDFVFIDDDESLANSLCAFLEGRGLKANAHNSADNFLNNLHKYPKDTKIVADHELKQGENGFDLLEKLHEYGYSRLYLMSGRSLEKQEIPSYITVILKSKDSLEELLNA